MNKTSGNKKTILKNLRNAKNILSTGLLSLEAGDNLEVIEKLRAARSYLRKADRLIVRHHILECVLKRNGVVKNQTIDEIIVSYKYFNKLYV